jgi:hypothetical protein
MLISSLLFVIPLTGYIPEDELIFDQALMVESAEINTNFSLVIFVKNFLNYSITDITITVNLTDVTALSFTSCDFGVLSGENITLNTTMESSSEYGFTAANITYGYMTADLLTFNISKIVNGTKFAFYYNVTAEQEGLVQFTEAEMSYYDNWGDLIEIEATRLLQLRFTSGKIDWDPLIPYWNVGDKIKIGWAWVLFGLSPVFIAVISSIVLYIRRR